MDRFRDRPISRLLHQARHFSVASLFLCATLAALAQPARGPEWHQLGAKEQYILKSLSQDWDQLDAARKSKWLTIAKQYQKLEPEQQARLQERMAAWSQLSPEERTLARMNFAELRSVPKSERQAQWEAYNALSDETKQELARKAAERQKQPTPSGAASPASTPGPRSGLLLKGGKPVGFVTIQAGNGASTRTLTDKPLVPAHQHIGQSKVLSDLQAIHPVTLLPLRGPQAAGMARQPASAPTVR